MMPAWLEPWLPLLTAILPLSLVEWIRRRGEARIATIKAEVDRERRAGNLGLEETKLLFHERRKDNETLRAELETMKAEIGALRRANRECEDDRRIANVRLTRLEEQVRLGRADSNLGQAGGAA